MTVVALLHPGAMGAAVGRQAVNVGANVRWVAKARSGATGERAADAGLEQHDEMVTALDGADIVLSICPPAFAEDVARAVGRFRGIYVDANAIAPARMLRIAAILPEARLVDGGIIGGPPTHRGTTRMYLSGDADGVPELFEGSALEAVRLPGGIGQASALKMAFASYQKASRVLAAVSHALAGEYGVGAQLVREADLLHGRPLADVEVFTAAAARAWRWAPEMRDAAAALHDVGLPDGLAVGAATALERWATAKDRDDISVTEVLRLLTERR